MKCDENLSLNTNQLKNLIKFQYTFEVKCINFTTSIPKRLTVTVMISTAPVYVVCTVCDDDYHYPGGSSECLEVSSANTASSTFTIT